MRRILGEHFRSDGTPKRAYPTKVKAETGLPLGQVVYVCSVCAKWHRATANQRRFPVKSRLTR